jgi:hypothetical protein
MMNNIRIDDFKNWKDIFQKKLEVSKFYLKTELKKRRYGGECFIPLNRNFNTKILIGYLYDKLIYWKFENPFAVGFNKYQDQEYFYRNHFTPDKSYGNPGLEFNKYNIEQINSKLDNGLKGTEIQYFKNNILIKSKLILYERLEYSTTINFEKKSFWQNLFDNKDENLTEKRIELSEIFNGLKKPDLKISFKNKS